MASGRSPVGRDRKPPKVSASEPRPKRRPVPRFDPSLETELSLNTELRRAEESINHGSLPNNLGWSLGANGFVPERITTNGSQKKGKHFEQVKLKEASRSPESTQPVEFRRKKHHTPATIPRTKLPSGTPVAERMSLERLRQQLSFADEELPSRGPSTSGIQASTFSGRSPAANNERAIPSSRPGGTVHIPVRETNDMDIANSGNAECEQVDTSKILARLRQVRDFLKQATSMFVSMSTGGTEEEKTRDFEQAAKLARLIKHLKIQEKAYTNLLQRSLAVEDDSATENTPSLSMHSYSEEEKSETQTSRNEELQGLRQQHALLEKMLQQQQQLKDLQSRQAALLTLQRDAEQRLEEAEVEGEQLTNIVEEGAAGGAEYETASGRSRSGTEASQLSEVTAEENKDEWGLTPEQLALHNFMERHKEKFRADHADEKDRDDRHQRKGKKNQQAARSGHGLTVDFQSTSDGQPDNEEAALAIADAAQERLELENKLMALQAQKEQMDSLLSELQQLREAQLRKESIEGQKPCGSSVNEAKRDNDEEKQLATTSQKLDDDSILEALEVHEKLRRLQDVRQHLKQLRDMIGHYQTNPPGTEGLAGDLIFQENVAMATAEDSAPESGQADEEEDGMGAVGGAAPTDLVSVSSIPHQDHISVDWILNYGIEDPELISKLRQLQAARERVLHLKQTNQTPQLSVGTSRLHNETTTQEPSQSQTEASETDGGTDTESNVSQASSSVNALAWQDDPEFQEKIKKLNSAKKKLKQLQELVKRVQQFPNGAPVLPTELAELSFDEVDDEVDDDDDDPEDEDDNDNDDDEDGDDGNDETDESDDSSSDDDDDLPDEEEQPTDGTRNLQDISVSEQEAEYQVRLQKQKNKLDRLLGERHRLFELQQELSRITQQPSETQAAAQNKTNPGRLAMKASKPSNSASQGLVRTETFTVHRPTVPVRHVSDSATQTPAFDLPRTVKPHKSYSMDSNEPVQAGTTSSALVWSELRRQRELHEEKLKKRKHRLLNEKRKKAGLDDVSEGGTYSLRSADVDEGFGVSMMSADITTATWGGSTQPSSTQNDSAVSGDESEEGNQGEEIAVEVEDDYPDGIVQAEEEEEERDEQDHYSGAAADVFRSRERAPRNYTYSGIERSMLGKKRKLNGHGARASTKSDGALIFGAWPRVRADRSPRQRLRQQNFTPAEQLIEEREREQFVLERQAWEQQCGQLHEEVAKLTNMCNNLLRDQQTLIKAMIGRNNLKSPAPQMTPMSQDNDSNPFHQYQQKQQDAYQSLQSFFDHQRYLLQQQHLVQTLNQCYVQLNQQQEDLGYLQGQFQQLFSGHGVPSPFGPSPLPRQGGVPSSEAPIYPCSGPSNMAPQAFPSLPVYSTTPGNTIFTQPRVPGASSTFTYGPFQMSGNNEASGLMADPLYRCGVSAPSPAAPAAGNIEVPSWMPVFTDARRFPSHGTQTEEAANPDTGVPSPRFNASTSTSTPPAGQMGQPRTSGHGPMAKPMANPDRPASSLLRNYNPSVYAENSTLTASSTQPAEVVGRTFPTPLRAQALANLANKDRSSQTLEHAIESVETSSQTSSVPGVHNSAKGASDAGSEFSLFEALRDSIYSEVATLISLNESRPHFLIELFRELQLLTSDYLRQRALYALRDIVTRFLTEDTLASGIVDKSLQQARFLAWTGSNSELTPSETVGTSEDESRDEAAAAEIVTEGVYDYVENVESGSTLSTPTSSHTGDAPFASDVLGETVIHFDQALSKMREFERLRSEGKLRQLESLSAAGKIRDNKLVKDDVTTSSAGDVGSDSSFSDVQYPRIDTQALDHQIKSIMSEVIPYLNEHMEDTCTADLMGYIRGLVLSRIKVRDEQEFGRFFHKQLASILQDSLAKFEGLIMKDCGEDMLVDMSEILFNELAFFRLMQDLDGTGGRGGVPFWRQEAASGPDAGSTDQEADKEEEREGDDQQPEDSATEETESTTRENVEQDTGENKNNENADDANGSSSSDDTSSSEDSDAEDEAAADDEAEEIPITKQQKEAEEEELGKDRDDDMATQFEDMPESAKCNSTESQQCVKLELSVSESKPFTSAGSGEEDGEESYDDLQAKRTLEECEGGTAAGRARAGRDSDDSDMSDAPQDDQAQATAAALPECLHNGQVILDDLPTKLTGLTEADLQARIAEEESRSEGAQGVIRHMENAAPELVGESDALPEPEPSMSAVSGDPPEGEK